MAYRQYSTDYVRAEDEAKAARRGIWDGEFVPPSDYRRTKPLKS
jgi:endonuclease YncB( thermonuclease family)